MGNLFRSLGISAKTVGRLSEAEMKEFIKLRYRALVGLVHPDKDEEGAQYFQEIQEAYEDSETPVFYDEQRDEWLAKFGVVAIDDQPIRDPWMGEVTDVPFEICNLENRIIEHLSPGFSGWCRDPILPWEKQLRAIRPPYALLLQDNLARIVSEAMDRQRSLREADYIPGLAVSDDATTWLELRMLPGKTCAEMCRVEYVQYAGYAKAPDPLLPADWFSDLPLLLVSDKEPQHTKLRPLGCVHLPNREGGQSHADKNWDLLTCWHHLLLHRYPDAQDLHMAAHGFSWERFRKLAPYVVPRFVTGHPLVALDDSGEEPLFRVFSELETVRTSREFHD